MREIEGKIYSDQKENPNVYTREWLEDKVNEFLKKGKIKVLPPCSFSQGAEPMSVIRKRKE